MVNLSCETNETCHGELLTITLFYLKNLLTLLNAYTELAAKEGPYEWTNLT